MPVKIKHTKELIDLLEKNYREFNRLNFIEDDPIRIPHQFSKKEDIEIAGFLTAIIAWGQRKTIINNANKLVEMMDHSPHEFILSHKETDMIPMKNFVHRTFNSDDLLYFIYALKELYKEKGGLEMAFLNGDTMEERISNFKKSFFQYPHLSRSEKHLADPLKGSSAKRINMYLRWMVRKDSKNVDFGIWDTIKSSELMMPLDVHTATVGRKLGLLRRKQNDWKAVVELTEQLRTIDPMDPVKYDFALFGMGVYGVL